MTGAVGRVLAALARAGCNPVQRGEGRWTARCPAHGDRTPSLSLAEGRESPVVLHDHGGCPAEDVLATLGLSWAEVLDGGERCAPIDRRRRMSSRRTATAWAVGPEYPSLEQVSGLWNACIPVRADPEASAWLVSRGLAPDRVDLECLARALPQDAPLPRWARGPGGPWSASGHRLILPAFDAHGSLVTMRARRIAASGGPKTLSPARHSHKACAFACLTAQAMLRGRSSRHGRPPAQRVVIVEGDADFLTWATRAPECHEDPPAVLAVWSGAWTQDLADRIPDGARVVIRTHPDASGETYARRIHATLRRRCDTMRPRAEVRT